MGGVGGQKGMNPRGRGPFPTVIARVEVPFDMKQERERERDRRQGASPPGKFSDHTL